MNIVEFLAARIQEDEDTARAAARAAENGYNTEPPWEFDGDEVVVADGRGIIIGPWGIEHEIGRHAERFQPARVLREVEAKRGMVAEHADGGYYVYDDTYRSCETCGDYTTKWPCSTLRNLASVYSDHSDYNPEWSTA